MYQDLTFQNGIFNGFTYPEQSVSAEVGGKLYELKPYFLTTYYVAHHSMYLCKT